MADGRPDRAIRLSNECGRADRAPPSLIHLPLRKERGRALRKPSLVRADLPAQVPGYIPTPPHATTKLFDTARVATSPAPGENRRGTECADTSRLAPIANPIVNLTLTAQRRGLGGENATTAWTLQSLSCKTIRGMRVRESGTGLSRRAIRRGKGRDGASVKPRVLRILGRQAWRRAGAGPQRDRARGGARTA